MAWTKAKTAIVATAAVLLAAGTTTVTVKKIHERNLDSQWDIGQVDSRILNKSPHIVRIIPTRYPSRGGWAINNYRVIGLNGDVHALIQAAYGYSYNRTVYLASELPGKYDFIANLPTGSKEAMQKEIRKQFGLVGRTATVETNVLFLKVKQPGAAGLVPTKIRNGGSSSQSQPGDAKLSNASAGSIANVSENELKIPVIDQTGLKGGFDIDLKWKSQDNAQHDNFKQAINDQLGLELVPGTAPVEFLFIEKVK